MKLDVKLDKEDNGNIKFSIDCDKEFSAIVNKYAEEWIHDAIQLYITTQYPTPIHSISSLERKEDDKMSKGGNSSSSRDINYTDNRTSDDITKTGSNPVVRNPKDNINP